MNPFESSRKSSRGGVLDIPEIPKSWTEVASIDFAGLDRDCEERIIYRTPGGKLKASKSCENEPVVIEDVTREQVVRWLLECVIPEEFEPDFRRALPNVATKGGCEMNRLTSKQIDARDAQDLLENAVTTSAALLEAIAELLSTGEQSPSGPMLSAATVDGLLMLARDRGETLRNHFQVFVEARRSQ